MATNNDGGPAFPRDEHVHGHNGMTLRDYFAAKALVGLIAEPVEGCGEAMVHNVGDAACALFAKAAYAMADAMLKARE